jgi:hypothetical protein
MTLALFAFAFAAPVLAPGLAMSPGVDVSPVPITTPAVAEPHPGSQDGGLEYLVPELAGDPFAIGDGRRPFQHRLSFSPGAGRLGGEPLYVLRFAYCPNTWLGWEAGIGHNPGEGVHALTHSLSAQLRYPLPWRVQPYASVGYGMILVYPGEALNADPVTSNVLYAGGGLELYVRNDLAIRAEIRSATVLDTAGPDGDTVAYDYGEATAGLSFYRGLGN